MTFAADAPATDNRASARIAAIRSDRRGLALIEFAMVLPVAIALYLGSYQIGDAMTCNRRVTIATRAVADLVAQNLTGVTTAAEVDGDLAAGNLVLAPYAASRAVFRITEVGTDALGKTTVQWSRATNAAPYVKGAVATIPASMKVPGTYFLYAELAYSYAPAANFGVVNAFKINDSLYMVPRNSTNISCSDC